MSETLSFHSADTAVWVTVGDGVAVVAEDTAAGVGVVVVGVVVVGASWTGSWELRTDTNVTDILDNFATEYPDWAAQGFEIAGFVWWQGHKDQGSHASLLPRWSQTL